VAAAAAAAAGGGHRPPPPPPVSPTSLRILKREVTIVAIIMIIITIIAVLPHFSPRNQRRCPFDRGIYHEDHDLVLHTHFFDEQW